MTRPLHSNRLGDVCLVACIGLWIAQSETIQLVQTTLGYNKPFFIVWVSNSLFSLALPILAVNTYLSGNEYAPLVTSPYFSPATRYSASKFSLFKHRLKRIFSKISPAPIPSFKLIAILSVLSTVPSFLWYVALPRTTVSDITSIANTSCIFAYFFAVVILRDEVQKAKVIALVVSFAGVVAISVSAALQVKEGAIVTAPGQTVPLPPAVPPPNGTITPSPSPQDTRLRTSLETRLFGDLLGLVGSAMFGLWDVCYTLHTRNMSPAIPRTSQSSEPPPISGFKMSVSLAITGLTGLFTFCILWLVFPVFHLTGIEVFEWPNKEVTKHLLVISIMNLIYNLLYVAGMQIKGSIVFAAGLQLALPVTLLMDVILRAENPHWLGLVGVALILGAQSSLADRRKREPSDRLFSSELSEIN